jgi:hypothetical protein
MVPYVYGYPAGPPPEDGSADDFFTAGCLPDFPSPEWGCRICEIRKRENDYIEWVSEARELVAKLAPDTTAGEDPSPEYLEAVKELQDLIEIFGDIDQ